MYSKEPPAVSQTNHDPTPIIYLNIKLTVMKVRIDTKNWMGNYSGRIQIFESEGHLNNYLRFMRNHEIESKIIGFEILE